MTRRSVLLACFLLLVAGLSVGPAFAQGVIAEVTSERTPTFTSSGAPGPVVAGRELVGKFAKPEGQFGLMGVDTASGHVLVRRSAILLVQGGARPRVAACDTIKNMAPSSRNFGSNGLGEGCPAANP